MTDRHLIIFCGNFPFGFGEPFLEVELGYLGEHFNRITICTTGNLDNEEHFDVPEGVSLIP